MEHSQEPVKKHSLRPKSYQQIAKKHVFGRKKHWADDHADSSVEKEKSVKFVNSTMEILQNQMKKDEAPKKKRTRTSPEQLRILQKAFNQDPMPTSASRVQLAKKLGMNVRAVQVWFQNRRAKGKLEAKKQEASIVDDESPAIDDPPSKSFHFRQDRPIQRSHSLPVCDFESKMFGASLFSNETEFNIQPEFSALEQIEPYYATLQGNNASPSLNDFSFPFLEQELELNPQMKRSFSSPDVHYFLSPPEVDHLQHFETKLDSIKEDDSVELGEFLQEGEIGGPFHF